MEAIRFLGIIFFGSIPVNGHGYLFIFAFYWFLFIGNTGKK
jgi:hypothetical protein